MGKKVNTSEAMVEAFNKGAELADELFGDIAEAEFKIVQPFDDGNAVIISVEGEGEERSIKYDVSDSVIVLEKREGTLNVFV